MNEHRLIVLAILFVAIGIMVPINAIWFWSRYVEPRGKVFEMSQDGSIVSCKGTLEVGANTSDYAKGVNDALDTIALLSLEQQLQGTNRTWGTMGEIVCSRLRVERQIVGRKERTR